MAGTGYHPEGHKPRLYDGSIVCRDPNHKHTICSTCAQVCPNLDDPEDECIDDC